MWRILTLATLALSQIGNWHSGGDLTNPADLTSNMDTITNPRGAVLSPIRIFFDTTGLSGTLLAKIQSATPKVEAYLANTLKVNPILGSLNLGTFNCDGRSITMGQVNADFYIKYLTRVPGCANQEACVTGFTASCHVHKLQKNNAVGGIAYLNEAMFLSHNDYQQWTFLLHQAINLLGFSEELSKFWDNNVVKYTEAQRFVTRNIRGVSKKFVITPSVVFETQAAWNLDGAELEEQNLKVPYTRSANKAHHWDARFLVNDIMTQRGFHEMIISRVTLALLKDTNWYDVDFTRAQSPIWGRAEKCVFTDRPCYIETSYTLTPRYWCFKKDQKGCDAMRTFKGVCHMTPCTYSNFLFEYFCPSGAACDGGDIFTDYCPYIVPSISGDCRLESNGRNDQNSATSKKIEIYGLTSRCFEHNLVLGAQRDLELDTACLQVDCTKTPYEIKLQSKVSGQFINVQCVEDGWVRVPEWGNGYIKCWPRNEVCGDAPCKDTCNGRGACVGATCQCFNGFSGPSCDVPCDPTCVRCSSATTCLECKPGFYLENGKCKKCPVECPTCRSSDDCTSCISPGVLYNLVVENGKGICKPICSAGCKECTAPDNCITPEDGKCFDINGGLANCCGNCQVCSKTRCCECKECKANFFLTSIGTCTNQCAANCRICASIYDCATCNPGFLLNDDKKCIRCPPGCSLCDDVCPVTCVEEGVTVTCNQADCFNTCPSCSEPKCIQCFGGFTLDPAGNCIRNCPDNCRTCTSNTVCTACHGGFAINSNRLCTPCEAGCSTCNLIPGDITKTDCIRCYSGYYIGYRNPTDTNDRDCFNCMPGCVSCLEHKTCDICTIRWFLDLYGFRDCKRCVHGCRRCLSSDICIETETGFYLNLDSYLPVRCHASCATCGADLICTSCVGGFFFYQCTSSNCLCRYCEPNCARCSGPIECVVCRCGYYLAGLNECRGCDPTCYSCDRPGQCNSCRGRFFLNSVTKLCVQCSTGCVSCVDQNYCRCCAAKFWPDEYVCKPCPLRCALCWTETDCYACVTGWYLDKCSTCQVPVVSCERCHERCIRCGGPVDCYVCRSGFFLRAGECFNCGPNCAICEDENLCTICNKGFYLSADRKCIKCEVGCFDCCDANTCLKAFCGYYLQSFTLPNTQNLGARAVKCEDNCRQCTGIGLCTAVNNGFYLLDGSPKRCPEKCSSCNNPGFCTRCVNRHYLKDGACLECAENCNSCDANGCTTPKSGFYVGVCPTTRFNIPYSCKSPCTTCAGEGDGDCFACRATFGYLDNDDITRKTYRCRPCQNNCRSCTRHDFCRNCNPGFYIWTDGSVGKCPDVCTSCRADTSSQVSAPFCLACRTGFGVTNGVCVSCPANCNKCSNNVCEICRNGFFISPTGSCSICTHNCLLCLSVSSSCTACHSGFYLTSRPTGSCLNCMSKCLRCTSSTTCDCCAGGHFFDVGTSIRPASCSYCGDGCRRCGFGAGCSQAAEGFYIDYSGDLPVSKSCRSKSPFCRLCSQLKDPVTNVYSVVCSACTTSARKVPNC